MDAKIGAKPAAMASMAVHNTWERIGFKSPLGKGKSACGTDVQGWRENGSTTKNTRDSAKHKLRFFFVPFVTFVVKAFTAP